MEEHLQRIDTENNKNAHPKQACGMQPVRIDSGCNATTDLVQTRCSSPCDCVSYILYLWMRFFILTKNKFLTLFVKLQTIGDNAVLFLMHKRQPIWTNMTDMLQQFSSYKTKNCLTARARSPHPVLLSPRKAMGWDSGNICPLVLRTFQGT